jgi:hypothetical protein
MKGFTLAMCLVFVFIFSPLFVQGQEVCPHTGGWEKSNENEQHVTITIAGDTITFTPDPGWKIYAICLKAGTDVYQQTFEGGTSDTIVVRSPNDHDVSHGAALMVQPEPTSTPTVTNTPTSTIVPSQTPTPDPSETPEVTNTPTLPTDTPPPEPSNTPTSTPPWSGTPTPWPTKECTVEICSGTG